LEGVVQRKILIVDDSEVMRRILKNLLEKNQEWTVDAEATDGRDAVEKAKKLRPDLTILDFSMPAMDGLELAGELKRIDPQMPIVMLTAFKNESLNRKAYKAGVTWVLSKSEGIDRVYDFARILLRPNSPPAQLATQAEVLLPNPDRAFPRRRQPIFRTKEL
jgi:DNA-binding NarL/FixJ family response regulator